MPLLQEKFSKMCYLNCAFSILHVIDDNAMKYYYVCKSVLCLSTRRWILFYFRSIFAVLRKGKEEERERESTLSRNSKYINVTRTTVQK